MRGKVKGLRKDLILKLNKFFSFSIICYFVHPKKNLTLYKTFGMAVGFKKYLHGVADAGSRLFQSGTHGLNEELGRHRGREGNKECELCGNECECVSHVLWKCSALL